MMPSTFSHPNGFNEARAIPPMNRSIKTAMFPKLAFMILFLGVQRYKIFITNNGYLTLLHSPGWRVPRLRSPIWTRMSRKVGKPTAAVMWRT